METEFSLLTEERDTQLATVPDLWQSAREGFLDRSKALKKARLNYRQGVDNAYDSLVRLQELIAAADHLAELDKELTGLPQIIQDLSQKDGVDAIKAVEKKLGAVAGSSKIKSRLSKARRSLKKKKPKMDKVHNHLSEGVKLFESEVAWRSRAKVELLDDLQGYDDLLKDSIGLRLQRYMTTEQAKFVAVCHSHHKDVSLNF